MTLDRAPMASDLRGLTAQAAAQWGDRTAWVFDNPFARRTFAEVEAQTNQVAHGLARLGVRPGDGVGICLRNVVDWPLAWLGVAKLGAFTVPLNVKYQAVDAGHLLRHSGAVAVITDIGAEPRLAAMFGELRPQLPALRELTSVAELLEGSPSSSLGVPLSPETVANVQYTSGTTGLPKGCMLDHRWFTVIARVASRWVTRLDPDEVVLTAQPFSYVDPQWNVAAGLLSGARVVVLDGFHPTTFWAKCGEHDVTFFYCLGAMPSLLLETEPSPADRAHRVRSVSCSAIPVHRHHELEERFGAPWHELYGSTECGLDIAVTEDRHGEFVGSGLLGHPGPHREVIVVGADGAPLPPGEQGELCVRGLGMFQGYFHDPEATVQAFRDGWYHTGDLAVLDGDGRVRFVRRTKDMIRRSGENIAAAEVEAVLMAHPAVRLAACVAVPDDLRQEEIKAVLAPVEALTPDKVDLVDVAAFAAERLAGFKVPRYWEVREELPLTPSQRVAKHRLSDTGAVSVWDRTRAADG